MSQRGEAYVFSDADLDKRVDFNTGKYLSLPDLSGGMGGNGVGRDQNIYILQHRYHEAILLRGALKPGRN